MSKEAKNITIIDSLTSEIKPMSVDQRSTPRKNVALDIYINNGFLDARPWHTRDIAQDSAFVKMKQPQLMPGTHVEAVLTLKYQDKSEQYRLNAEIIRVSKEGLVLKFKDHSEETQLALENFIQSD